jgi:hypothetical protein
MRFKFCGVTWFAASSFQGLRVMHEPTLGTEASQSQTRSLISIPNSSCWSFYHFGIGVVKMKLS